MDLKKLIISICIQCTDFRVKKLSLRFMVELDYFNFSYFEFKIYDKFWSNLYNLFFKI
jgi:hypothetical protein